MYVQIFHSQDTYWINKTSFLYSAEVIKWDKTTIQPNAHELLNPAFNNIFNYIEITIVINT